VQKRTLSAGTPIGAGYIPVVDGSQFQNGDSILIGADGSQEKATITTVVVNTLNLSSSLTLTHTAADKVINLDRNWIGPWRAVVGSGV